MLRVPFHQGGPDDSAFIVLFFPCVHLFFFSLRIKSYRFIRFNVHSLKFMGLLFTSNSPAKNLTFYTPSGLFKPGKTVLFFMYRSSKLYSLTSQNTTCYQFLIPPAFKYGY